MIAEKMALWRVGLGVAGILASIYTIIRKVVKDLRDDIEKVRSEKQEVEDKVMGLETQVARLEDKAVTQQDLNNAFERQNSYIQQVVTTAMEPMKRELEHTLETISRIERRVDGVMQWSGKPLDS